MLVTYAFGLQVWKISQGWATGREGGSERLQQMETRGDAGVRRRDDEDEAGAGKVRMFNIYLIVKLNYAVDELFMFFFFEET